MFISVFSYCNKPQCLLAVGSDTIVATEQLQTAKVRLQQKRPLATSEKPKMTATTTGSGNGNVK